MIIQISLASEVFFAKQISYMKSSNKSSVGTEIVRDIILFLSNKKKIASQQSRLFNLSFVFIDSLKLLI